MVNALYGSAVINLDRKKDNRMSRSGVDKGFPDIIGHTGRFALLPVNILHVDHEYYQRTDVRDAALEKIAANWSWPVCGAVTVSERPDGTFWLLDGQRRWLAALKRGDISNLPCMVYRFDNVVDETNTFLRINKDRISVKLRDRHRANLTLSDDTALSVKTFVERSGRSLGFVKDATSITCVFRLEQAIRSDMPALSRIWDILIELAYGRKLDEEILMAMHYVESNAAPGHSLANKQWRERLLKFGYDRILEECSRFAKAREHNSSKLYAQGLIGLLNFGMKVNRFSLDGFDLGPDGKPHRFNRKSDQIAAWYPTLFEKVRKENAERLNKASGFNQSAEAA